MHIEVTSEGNLQPMLPNSVKSCIKVFKEFGVSAQTGAWPADSANDSVRMGAMETDTQTFS